MTTRIKIFSALGALLIVVAGVSAGIWIQRDGLATGIDKDADRVAVDADHVAADADAVPTDLVRQAAPIYYTFDPELTVNIKDTDAVFQVGISLSTHFAATADALKNDDPALRSAIIMALAEVSEAAIQSDAGKTQMLTTIVTAVNQQLRVDGYRGSVDSAYFTDFIVQDDAAASSAVTRSN